MTKDNIITLPHRSLRQNSQRVGYINNDIKKIVEDMKAATLDWEASREHELGVALAAVQINKLLRIVVVRNSHENKSDKTFSVLINPEITKKEGKMVADYEGCLSIKDVYGLVERYEKVRVKALDLDGRSFSLKAEGFMARVLQHEIDHTHGVVFIDHIKDQSNAFFRLDDQGKIEPLDYSKDIAGNATLWN